MNLRQQTQSIKESARELFDKGATGIQVSAFLSSETDKFLIGLYEERVSELTPAQQAAVVNDSAMIAVGGSGRGELAPYSDADILFVYRPSLGTTYTDLVATVVRTFWDANIKLGHNVCTLNEVIALCREEPQSATALIEARLLHGSDKLFHKLTHNVRRLVIQRNRRSFIDRVVEEREVERQQHGSSIYQLEPNIKRSPGGLRDAHLIRWVGAAAFGVTDMNQLQLAGGLNREDVLRLKGAYDFLLRMRCDLHFNHGKANDVLTRDEQLRITEQRNIHPGIGQRPVERFMQTYFRHSTAIAEISQRFVDRHRPRSRRRRLMQLAMSHHVDNLFRVNADYIDVVPRYRKPICEDLEQILRMYHAAVHYGVLPTPLMTDLLKVTSEKIDRELSDKSRQLFLGIFRCTLELPRVLRSMFLTGVLDAVIPDVTHIRCLLQFNQYHSYTVDEHTLRAIEAVTRFEVDDGPVGAAYRQVHHKEVLHLAVLLHDIGKGVEEDHSIVGERVAYHVADRLKLPEHHRESLTFLVRHHLRMSHIAFRRDISDPALLIEFAREVGSTERLRMLYTLTAADLTAVGPDVWNDWKSEVLSELFERTMVLLSGRHIGFGAEQRLEQLISAVKNSFVPLESFSLKGGVDLDVWLRSRLNNFPPHYLSNTTPEQIAADLSEVDNLPANSIIVTGHQHVETGIVEYRLIAHENMVRGCFHKSAGVLTASHLEILSAQISTDRNGIVVDRFYVVDNDYAGEIPPERIDTITGLLKKALTEPLELPRLFVKQQRYDTLQDNEPVSELPSRVVIDNDSSDRCTVIDVFTNDRPGLLYTISRALYDMELSVELAKIATHLDQVVDVFYVTDGEGHKIRQGDRLHAIYVRLSEVVNDFERTGHKQFVSSRS